MLTFYIVKFVQYMLLPPGIFILLFVILQRFKKLLIALSILFWLLSSKFIAYKLINPLEEGYRKSATINANSVVVLGGGYYKDAPNMPLSEESYKRLIFAIMLAKKNSIPIIFDGSKNEAVAVRKCVKELNSNFKIDLNISNSSKYKKEFTIYIQNRALTTIDNAKYVKNFFNANHLSRTNFYLVTSAYHLSRALKEFNKQLLYPTPKATDFKTSKEFRIIDLLPTAEGLLISTKALHEYLGLLKFGLTSKM